MNNSILYVKLSRILPMYLNLEFFQNIILVIFHHVLDIPSVPANLAVTGTADGSISISWDAPRSDGGSPITGYLIETCKSGMRNWDKAGKVNATSAAFDISGLAAGEYYFIRVFAENQVGISKRAAEVSEAVCAKKPTSEFLYYLVLCIIKKYMHVSASYNSSLE